MNIIFLSLKSFLLFAVISPLLIKFIKKNSLLIQGLVYFCFIIFFTLVFDKIINNYYSFWVYFCNFSFLVAIYIFIFGALESSISIQILNFLSTKKKSSVVKITQKTVLNNFMKRVYFLKKKKIINIDNEKFYLTNKGSKIVRLISKIRKLFNLKNLGFYK